MQTRRAEVQLEGVLDGDQQLRLRDLGDQRAQQRGLARTGAAHHQHVGRVRRTHRGPQHPDDLRRDGALLHQTRHGGVQQAVAADDHRRALRHRRDGEQAVPRGQPQVEDRRRRVETPRGVAGGGREVADHHDQLFLAARNRPHQDALAVGQRQDHVVVAEDVDVLDVVAIEQRGQRPTAHEPPDIADELLHTLGAELRRARDQSGGVVLADDGLAQVDELPVDLVGGQLLAFHVEKALEQELVVPAKQCDRRTYIWHGGGSLTRSGLGHDAPP